MISFSLPFQCFDANTWTDDIMKIIDIGSFEHSVDGTDADERTDEGGMDPFTAER